MNRSGSSPPSPVLLLAPIRFIAIASVSCASLLIAPKDMAPVVNRLTISFAGSTSSSGIGSGRNLNSSSPRRFERRLLSSFTSCAKIRRRSSDRWPSWSLLKLINRVGIPVVVLALDAVVDLPAEIELSDRCRLVGHAVPPKVSSPISRMPMPSMREAVPVKYRSMSS